MMSRSELGTGDTKVDSSEVSSVARSVVRVRYSVYLK